MAEGTRGSERWDKIRQVCAGGVARLPGDGAVGRPRGPEVGGASPMGRGISVTLGAGPKWRNPRGSGGGFELANGRAADRLSEKEAEAGRSRRGSRTASAAASPWHDPGLRLQRLHKETVLGAAVPLLVRGRAAGRGGAQSHAGSSPALPAWGWLDRAPSSRPGALLSASEPGPPRPSLGAGPSSSR